MLRALWSRLASIAFWEIPRNRYDREGLYTQAILVVSFWALMEIRPTFTGHPVATGYAIAALALAAVVMAARADALTTAEKVVWIVISATFFIWELNVIDREHAEQELQYQTELHQREEEFRVTLSEFSSTKMQAEDILKRTGAAEDNAAEAVKNITGGDSWGWVEFFRDPTNVNIFHIAIVSEGKYPLRQVNLLIIDTSASFGASLSSCKLGDIPAHYNFVNTPCAITTAPDSIMKYTIIIQAANGNVSENVTLDSNTGVMNGTVHDNRHPLKKNQRIPSLLRTFTDFKPPPLP